MWFVVILALVILLFCLAGTSGKNKAAFWSVFFLICCFPIAVILELCKKHK